MTQEVKDLLLKYLCMAVPYGLKMVLLETGRADTLLEMYMPGYYGAVGTMLPTGETNSRRVYLPDYKPYLRPLSSMTESEKKELPFPWQLNFDEITSYNEVEGFVEITHKDTIKLIDFLLKNHFDFMELIPKGLAIEVNNENNPYKD